VDPILLIIAFGLTGGFVVYFMGRRETTQRLNVRGRMRLDVRDALDLKEQDAPGALPGREPMVGSVDGFPFRIDFAADERTTDSPMAPGDRDELSLRLQLPQLYLGISVRPETRYTRARMPDIATGDEAADDELLIFGPELHIAAIMNVSRRGALRQAVRRGLAIEHGELEARLRIEKVTADDVIDLARAMGRFARRLRVDTDIEGLLAANALNEPNPEVRRRCQVILLDRHRYAADAAARETARTLLSHPTDHEGRVRAADFLLQYDVLYQQATSPEPDAHVRALALRALSDVPETARQPLSALAPALNDPPQAPDSGYFAQVDRAIRHHCPNLLPTDFEAFVIATIRTFPDEARALCRLLGSKGSVAAVPALRELPKPLRREARAAISAIQSRMNLQGGGLAVVDDGDEGALSIDASGGSLAVAPTAWAVVPAKAFVEAKSRLSAELGHTERGRLARALLGRLLNELNHTRLAGILVATQSREVADLAQEYGAEVIADQQARGVAEVVAQALEAVHRAGANEALVLMADLPLFDRHDAEAMLDVVADGTIAVAPDRVDAGANATALRLPAPFALPFGRDDSFSAHVAMANSHQLSLHEHRTLGASLDLDKPEDLVLWREAARR